MFYDWPVVAEQRQSKAKLSKPKQSKKGQPQTEKSSREQRAPIMQMPTANCQLPAADSPNFIRPVYERAIN